MKSNYVKPIHLTVFALSCFAAFSLAKAGVQPSVTVKTYAQHVGSNVVFNYRVTNHGINPLTEINIGCNCPNDFTGKGPDSEPQLIAHPIDYLLTEEYAGPYEMTGFSGETSPGSFSAPTDWDGFVAHHDHRDLISFHFAAPYDSGIAILPGQTGTFSITTPAKDARKYFNVYEDRPKPKDKAFYELNRRGYLTGHFSYYDEDVNGKGQYFAYPMQLIDQTPPTLTVTLNPSTIWPPNGKLEAVTATIKVRDDYDPQPEIKLESITSSEALATGDIQGAQLGTDDRQFSLAAKRDGKNKTGRIYTVTYSATDGSGNKATASATVTVPHDQGK